MVMMVMTVYGGSDLGALFLVDPEEIGIKQRLYIQLIKGDDDNTKLMDKL